MIIRDEDHNYNSFDLTLALSYYLVYSMNYHHSFFETSTTCMLFGKFNLFYSFGNIQSLMLTESSYYNTFKVLLLDYNST